MEFRGGGYIKQWGLEVSNMHSSSSVVIVLLYKSLLYPIWKKNIGNVSDDRGVALVLKLLPISIILYSHFITNSNAHYFWMTLISCESGSDKTSSESFETVRFKTEYAGSVTVFPI